MNPVRTTSNAIAIAPHSALTAATRLMQVSVLFAIVYTSSNYLTSLRSDIGLGVFGWESAIPFVEWTVVPYLSIFALLPLSFFACRNADELECHTRRLLLALGLAVLCYAAFPLEFNFDRPEPISPLAPLFRMLWSIDLPYNRSPSLHITVLLLIWTRLTGRLSGLPRFGAHVWLASIGVSVLTTYQHHFIDILGGFAVASTCFVITAQATKQKVAALLRGVSAPVRTVSA